MKNTYLTNSVTLKLPHVIMQKMAPPGRVLVLAIWATMWLGCSDKNDVCPPDDRTRIVRIWTMICAEPFSDSSSKPSSEGYELNVIVPKISRSLPQEAMRSSAGHEIYVSTLPEFWSNALDDESVSVYCRWTNRNVPSPYIAVRFNGKSIQLSESELSSRKRGTYLIISKATQPEEAGRE